MNYTENSTILGPCLISHEDLLNYMLDHLDEKSGYNRHDLHAYILPAYRTICLGAGVDLQLAVAQMCHETGYLSSWWSQRPRRNPAGIGVNGIMSADIKDVEHTEYAPIDVRGVTIYRVGCSFNDWENEAIPCHIGRLLAYVWPQGMDRIQSSLVNIALRKRDLPMAVRGSAKTVKQLGKYHNRSNQGWASPGKFYGAAIARIANEMLNWKS